MPPSTSEFGRSRDRGVRRVLALVLAQNLVVAAIKFLVGNRTGTLSLMADSLHALLDASSNVVGLIGIVIASRPPDAGHPYGHRRFETLAALTIGLFILSGLGGIAYGLWEGFAGDRRPPEVSWASAALVLGTIVANLAISRYEAKRALELKSALLEADAGHTMSDTFGAFAVLVSFGGLALGFRSADSVGALVVAVLVGRTAFRILSVNLGVLADHARLDPAEVRQAVLQVPEVRGAHKIRSRGSADHTQVDLHVHVDPTMSVARAHEVTHAVIAAVRARFPEVADVIIHTEPADGRERDAT
ncbi:MAG TPA: cation diffusion facilitator family transporter [Polyangiaceae bacterium]|nr:cation diffusion facilitator family transporter [Polyangiaceae bacterium]